MASISVRSNAKINLFFEINSLRDDGYCNVTSLMCPIDLSDHIEFDISKSTNLKINFNCTLPFDKAHNTITRAIQLFSKQTKINNFAINITIQKNIPIGAGFGGGSSNGTAMLLALNEYFKNPLSLETLQILAQKIGTDCPFFIKNKAQLATGRGDILTPVPHIDHALRNYYCLVFCPEFSIATNQAYNEFKAKPNFTQRFKNPLPDELEALCFNSFEPQILAKYKDLNQIFHALSDEGFSPHITGSGSGGFILNQSKERLEIAQQIIQKCISNYRLCRIVTFL